MGTGGGGTNDDDDWDTDPNYEQPTNPSTQVDMDALKKDLTGVLDPNANNQPATVKRQVPIATPGRLNIAERGKAVTDLHERNAGTAVPSTNEITFDEPRGNITANNDTAASAVTVDLPAPSKIPTPPKLPPMPSATKPIAPKKAVAAKTDPDDASPVTEDISKLLANAMAGRRVSLENADDDKLEEKWDEEELHEAENEQTVSAALSSTSISNPSTTSGPTTDSNMPPSASPTIDNAPLVASAPNLSAPFNASDDLPPPEDPPPAFVDLPPPEDLAPAFDDLPPPDYLPPVFPGETDENPVISGSVALPVDNAQVLDTGSLADVISTTPIPDEAAPQQSVDNRSPQAKSLNLQGKSVHIYNEIMTTEKTYQKNLSLITDQMVEQILTALDKIPAKKRESIDRKNVETQLRILQQINKVTEEVIKALEKPDLAEVDKLIQFAKPLYAAYAQVSTPLPIYSKKSKPDLNFGSVEFSPTFDREKTGLNTDTNVNAILIQPIQRAARYVLLLEDLVKNTNDNSAVHEITKRAHKTSLEIATACNEGKRTFESQAQLTAILDAIGKSNSKNINTTKGPFVTEIAEQLIEQNNQKQPIDLAKAILAAYEKNASYVQLNIGKIPGFTNAESKQALEAARKVQAEQAASATKDNTPDSTPVAMSATVGAAAAELVGATSSPATTLDKDGDPRPTRPAPTPTSSPDASLALPQPALDALIVRLKKFESEVSVAAQENKKYGSSSAASILLDVKSAIAIIESNRDNPEQIRAKLAGLIDRTNAPFQPEVSKAFLDVLKGETPDSPTAASASKPYFGTTLPSNQNSDPNQQRSAVVQPKEKNLFQTILTRVRRKSAPGIIETAAPVEPKAPPRPTTAAPPNPPVVASQQPVSTNAAQPQLTQPVAAQQPVTSPPQRPASAAPLTPPPLTKESTTPSVLDTSDLNTAQKGKLEDFKKSLQSSLDKHATAEQKAEAAKPGSFAEEYKKNMKNMWEQTKKTFMESELPKDENEAFAQLLLFLMQLFALATSPGHQLLNTAMEKAWGEMKAKYHERQADKHDAKYNDVAHQEKRLASLEDLLETSTNKIADLESRVKQDGRPQFAQELAFEQAKHQLLTEARDNTIKHLQTLRNDNAVNLDTALTKSNAVDEDDVLEEVVAELGQLVQPDDLDDVLTASTPTPDQTATNTVNAPVSTQATSEAVPSPKITPFKRIERQNDEGKKLANDFFVAILNKDDAGLTALLTQSPKVEHNLIYPDVTLINIARALGNDNAVNLLVKHGADLTYANRVNLAKELGHIVKMDGETESSITLRDGSIARTSIGAEFSRPIHGMQFFKQQFDSFNKNNANRNFPDIVNQAMDFTRENYSRPDHGATKFAERIASNPDAATYLPSGYSGHNVGIIFNKGKLIVCDGADTSGNIHIYDVGNLSKDQITALLNANTESDYKKALQNVTKDKAPLIDLPSKGQKVNNCSYVNVVGAVEGLNYLNKVASGMLHDDAKKESHNERKQFNRASKDAMVSSVNNMMKDPGNREFATKLIVQFIEKYKEKAEKVKKGEIQLKDGKDVIGPNAFKRLQSLLTMLPAEQRISFLNDLKIELPKAQLDVIKDLPQAPPVVGQSNPTARGLPPQRFDAAQNPPPKKKATKPDDDADVDAALNNGPPPITPMQNRNATSAVASVSQQNLSELIAKLDEVKSENKLASFGIKEYTEVKAADGKPSHVNIQMYCDKAKTDTTEVKAETKPGSDGVTYSMKSGLEGEAREQTIEQICALAVETAKPGTVLSIPSGNTEKRKEIEAALDKAFEAKFGDKYEKGNYTIPDAPKSSASLNK